jgi:class 3 adenylate cyclase
VTVCLQCGQENPEIAKCCLACGAALAAPGPTLEEERKVVTALFADIVGSPASAERMDPEDVRARLAPYYGRVREELESFGGTVEKFIGDAVLAQPPTEQRRGSSNFDEADPCGQKGRRGRFRFEAIDTRND